MRILISLSAVALLAACDKPDNAPGPGGVTVGEAKALDEAAEMLEAEPLPDAAAPVATTQATPSAKGN